MSAAASFGNPYDVAGTGRSSSRGRAFCDSGLRGGAFVAASSAGASCSERRTGSGRCKLGGSPSLIYSNGRANSPSCIAVCPPAGDLASHFCHVPRRHSLGSDNRRRTRLPRSEDDLRRRVRCVLFR